MFAAVPKTPCNAVAITSTYLCRVWAVWVLIIEALHQCPLHNNTPNSTGPQEMQCHVVVEVGGNMHSGVELESKM